MPDKTGHNALRFLNLKDLRKSAPRQPGRISANRPTNTFKSTSIVTAMKYSIGLIRSAPKKPPIFLRFRSSEALIISTVALAIYTDIFLYGVPSPRDVIIDSLRKSFPFCLLRSRHERVLIPIQYSPVSRFYLLCMLQV